MFGSDLNLEPVFHKTFPCAMQSHQLATERRLAYHYNQLTRSSIPYLTQNSIHLILPAIDPRQLNPSNPKTGE